MSEDQTQLRVEIAPELETGVYANFAVVHSGEHELTIDFGQLMPNPTEDEGPRIRVVSRIRIAPSFVSPLLQAISQNAFRREDLLKRPHDDAKGREEG